MLKRTCEGGVPLWWIRRLLSCLPDVRPDGRTIVT